MKRQGKLQNPIRLPVNVSRILDTLDRHGEEAYIVGGCVRDYYLGRVPKDWDVTTSMEPDAVSSLFHSIPGCTVVPTGIQHGTVTVIPPGSKEGYEITTFRTDGTYSDGCHPDSVTFAKTIEEDLSRRDLTINAMAWSPKRGLVDPFGGMRDLKDGLIRTVGSPDQRFREDALRMMRVVRFSAQLGFDVDPDTYDAIRRNAGLIEQVSQERRTDELVKIMKSPRPGSVRMLHGTGLLAHTLPEVDRLFQVPQHNEWHVYDVGEHTMAALRNTPDASLEARLAVLFHDTGKATTRVRGEDGYDHFPEHPKESAEITRAAMRRMRFPADAITAVTKLVSIHDSVPDLTERSVRRFANRHGLDRQSFQDYHDVVHADAMAQNPEKTAEKLRLNDRFLSIYLEALDRKEPMTVKDLQVNGYDAMSLGLSGPAIGKALDGLLERVLDDPGLNTREQLMELLSHPDKEEASL